MEYKCKWGPLTQKMNQPEQKRCPKNTQTKKKKDVHPQKKNNRKKN